MNDIDYSKYDEEFDKLKLELSPVQRKDVVDFLYQLSHIAYNYHISQKKGNEHIND